MTILELKQTIEIMRTAYPFTDKGTKIQIYKDPMSGGDTIQLATTDVASETSVVLSRRVEGDGKSRVNQGVGVL